ncbi:MAG TPA: glycosyltransferase family 4 protein, partial [Spirochaetota bacterium]|nr:glycosyltransferase family 4 protein [Spirochaetota bacterium]
MNVIFISSIQIFRGESAGSSRMMNFAEGLRKNNKVYLFSYCSDIKKCEYTRIADNLFSAGKEVRSKSNKSVIDKVTDRLFYPLRVLKFYRNIKKHIQNLEGYSVILFYPSTQIIFDVLTILHFRIFSKLPVFYELNELRSKNLKDFQYSKDLFTGLKQRVKNFFHFIKYFFAESLYGYYSGVIAISTRIEKEMNRRGVNVLRIPILSEQTLPADNGSLSKPTQPIRLGYFGMISAQKEDFETILQAVSYLKKDDFAVELNLYGTADQNKKKEIHRIGNFLGISDEIKYRGTIPHSEVLCRMRENHFLLSVRRDSFQANYSFSTKLAEYLSSGVPVVVSEVGDNPYYIHDGINGVMVKTGDATAISEKISRIFKEYETVVPEIRKNAYETVANNFCMKANIDKFEKFLGCKRSDQPEKKLKIAICTLANFPEGLAVTNRVYYHAKGLKDNGADVKIFIVKPTEFPKKIVNREFKGEINGIPFEYAPKKTTRSLYFLQRRFDDITGPVIAANKIRKAKYDAAMLISSNSFYHATILKIIFRLAGIVFIAERTELTFHNKKIHGFYKYKNKLYSKFVYKNLDGFLAISYFLVDHYRKMVSKKCPVLLVPVLIDEKEIYRPNVKRTKNIVYTGPLLQKKDGILTILEAFSKIEKKHPESRLIMTGDINASADKEKIQNIIRDHDLKSSIEFTGFLSRDDMVELLNTAAVLVLAKPSSEQANACFPTKLGEYLSTGNAIAVTRTGEIPLYLKDGVSAYIAEPDRVDSFAEKLDAALSDPELSKRIGENGRRTAIEKFNYKNNTLSVINLIKDILD